MFEQHLRNSSLIHPCPVSYYITLSHSQSQIRHLDHCHPHSLYSAPVMTKTWPARQRSRCAPYHSLTSLPGPVPAHESIPATLAFPNHSHACCSSHFYLHINSRLAQWHTDPEVSWPKKKDSTIALPLLQFVSGVHHEYV